MPNPSAPLQRSTQTFVVHQIPLECDIYDASDYPQDSPVFLFFHSGGLVCGARVVVPPWLVQTCYRRKWPLVSASYRLLPQAQGDALLEDARAAYEFARALGGKSKRNIIAGGASAGFFLAAIIAHHLTPKPLALLSITGIPTFRHPFFNSSVLIPSEPVSEDDIGHFLTEPVSVGRSPCDPPAIFYPEQLLPSGAKDTAFEPPSRKPPAGFDQDPNRGLLYDYFLHENLFVDLVGSVDPGFDWVTDKSQEARLKAWPVTILIQGDDDYDVRPEVCSDVARKLGSQVGIYCEARGKPHLFEQRMFLEDIEQGQPADGAVAAMKMAIAALDGLVDGFKA